MIKFSLFAVILSITTFGAYGQNSTLSYNVKKAKTPIIVDGDIFTNEWSVAKWTSEFVDIQGAKRPVKPKYSTKAKMLWDDQYLYVAAVMEEPHLWGTITQRDEVIYWDNDFEVFIDVAKNGQNYYEFEFNVLNTQWDLMMTKPYKMGGTFNTLWNAEGLKTAVKTYGTINNPNDVDSMWTIEIAIPMRELTKNQPVDSVVKIGDRWRMNFSRVQWLKNEIIDDDYKKIEGTEGFGHEENWVWAPTGIIDIHMPDSWGFVTFVK